MDEQRDLGGVERRINATRAVRRIMHAISIVSRAQYSRVERSTIESVEYYRWIDEALARLASRAREDAERRLCVVFGPERALSGGLHRALERAIPAGDEFALVGSRLLQNEELAAEAVFVSRGVSSLADVEVEAAELGRLLARHALGRDVLLLFPVTAAGAVHRELLFARRLLKPEACLETYSPVSALLEAVLAQALTGRIAHALTQTLQAELGARLQITQRAQTHCDDKLVILEDQRRVIQREQTTVELSEVVAARSSSDHSSRSSSSTAVSSSTRTGLVR